MSQVGCGCAQGPELGQQRLAVRRKFKSRLNPAVVNFETVVNSESGFRVKFELVSQMAGQKNRPVPVHLGAGVVCAGSSSRHGSGHAPARPGGRLGLGRAAANFEDGAEDSEEAGWDSEEPERPASAGPRALGRPPAEGKSDSDSDA